MKCDGTRAETRFLLPAKRTSPFKSAGGRQFSRLLAAEVCAISGSNAGYTMFRGSVKGWLPTAFASFPFTSPPVRHRVPSHFNCSLQLYLFLTSALEAVWSSSRPGNSPRYLLRRLGVPQRPSGRFGKGLNRLSTAEIKLRISGSRPSHSKYRLNYLQLKATVF